MEDYKTWIEEVAQELNLGPPPAILAHCRIKRNYNCTKCSLFTQNPRRFLYHLRDQHHERIKVYECKWCIYASKHLQKLQRHIRMCHGNGNPGLSMQVVQQPEDEDHEDVMDDMETDDRQFEFGHFLSITGEDELQSQEHEENNSNSDPSCGFEGRNYENSSPHLKMNLGDEETDMPLMHSIFDDVDEVEADEIDEKTSGQLNPIKIFRCSICNYCTNIKARLTKHIKYHSLPNIKCEFCDFSSPYKWNLDRHYKNHFAEGPLSCPLCGTYRCDTKQSLTVHIQNHHSGIEPLKVQEHVQASQSHQNRDKEELLPAFNRVNVVNPGSRVGIGNVKTASRSFQERKPVPGYTRNQNAEHDLSGFDSAKIRLSVQPHSSRSASLRPNIYYSKNDFQRSQVKQKLGNNTPKNPLICTYCQLECSSVMDLNIHFLSCASAAEATGGDEDDQGEELQISPLCEQQFNSMAEADLTGYELSPGIGTVYTGSFNLSADKQPVSRKVYRCPLAGCGFFAAHASRFHVHIIGHNNIKPFECSVCKYKSNWKWDITKHIKLKEKVDLAHKVAKVVLVHESGERSYRKYDANLISMQLKYRSNSNDKLTLKPSRANYRDDSVKSQLSKLHDGSGSSSNLGNNNRQPDDSFQQMNDNGDQLTSESKGYYNSVAKLDGSDLSAAVKKAAGEIGEKEFIWKCKKCSFKHKNKATVGFHVRRYHPTGESKSVATSGSSEDRNMREQISTRDSNIQARCASQLEGPAKSSLKPNSVFKCTFCSFSTPTQSQLLEHVHLHSEETLEIAITPEETPPRPDGVPSSRYKKYHCVECPYENDSRGQFTYHKQFHLKRCLPFQCKYCSYNVSHKHLLQQHERIHAGTPSKCYEQNDESVKSSGSTINRGAVIKTNSSSTTKQNYVPIPYIVCKNGKRYDCFRCHSCTKVFKSLDFVLKHEKSHAKQTLFLCQECPARFVVQTNLSTHENYHRMSSQHKCPECSYSATEALHISSHIKVHSDEYSRRTEEFVEKNKDMFEPQYYQNLVQRFRKKTSSTLLIESQDGSDGNPNFTYPSYIKNGKLKNKKYKCFDCPSAFEKKDQYRIHRSLHGSGQRYQCTVCNYAVTYYANYVQHLKKHQVQPEIPKELLIPEPLSKRQNKTTPSLFRCYRCSFSTPQKLKFQQHVRKHYIIRAGGHKMN